ncbi:Hypothetical predicted protein [Podarcis lilfordi]|uniref:Uncharacterized protein n=1 Tax=Podarcis lilfordi TaxID=74358 RepID=A0AA35LBA5_9SAUR|nr:Hypothetical predicted protein [Podarcis lilfordi]
MDFPPYFVRRPPRVISPAVCVRRLGRLALPSGARASPVLAPAKEEPAAPSPRRRRRRVGRAWLVRRGGGGDFMGRGGGGGGGGGSLVARGRARPSGPRQVRRGACSASALGREAGDGAAARLLPSGAASRVAPAGLPPRPSPAAAAAAAAAAARRGRRARGPSGGRRGGGSPSRPPLLSSPPPPPPPPRSPFFERERETGQRRAKPGGFLLGNAFLSRDAGAWLEEEQVREKSQSRLDPACFSSKQING